MQPGDKITVIEQYTLLGTTREKERSGSVGCLLSSWDKQNERRQHFFTVALHVAKEEEDPFAPVVSRRVYNASRTVEGITVGDTSSLLDTCLVLIVNGSVGLGADSLPDVSIDGRQIRLTGVWDPTDTLRRLKEAQSADDENRIKQETMDVSHLGATLASRGRAQIGRFDGKIQYGLITKDLRKLRMTVRTTYPGDSGGPVFNKDGVLVGFIRRGAAKDVSTDTEIVLAYYVLEELENQLNRGFYFTHDGILN